MEMTANLSVNIEFFDIFGIHIGKTTVKHSLSVIRELIERDRCSYVCVSNTHVVVSAVKNPAYLKAINQADWNVPDGMPLVWYGRKQLGIQQLERVTGSTLMERCFDEMQEAKHFLYGSTQDTLRKIKALSSKKFPNLNIVGSYAPPFRSLTREEKKEIVSYVNELSPDIIWVALGAPKQELFMLEFQSEIRTGVMIGVGAAFDYFSGNIRRPPRWLRVSGLEWLGRLCQEPRRLGSRYLINNCLFLSYVIREFIVSRNRNRRVKSGYR